MGADPQKALMGSIGTQDTFDFENADGNNVAPVIAVESSGNDLSSQRKQFSGIYQDTVVDESVCEYDDEGDDRSVDSEVEEHMRKRSSMIMSAMRTNSNNDEDEDVSPLFGNVSSEPNISSSNSKGKS